MPTVTLFTTASHSAANEQCQMGHATCNNDTAHNGNPHALPVSVRLRQTIGVGNARISSRVIQLALPRVKSSVAFLCPGKVPHAFLPNQTGNAWSRGVVTTVAGTVVRRGVRNGR